MSTLTQRKATSSPLKLDVVIASLLLNAGILLALVTWITANRPDFFSGISNEQLRAALSILAVGAPVAAAAAAAGRLSARLPVDLGTGTLLALLAALSTVFTASAVLHFVLPGDSSLLGMLFHALINCGTIFLMARIFARRARRLPDWISITGTIFAVGLLPIGLVTLVVEVFFTWANISLAGGLPTQGVPPFVVALAALYLVVLLPVLFLGRALLQAESALYRPVERRFVEVLRCVWRWFARRGGGAARDFHGSTSSCKPARTTMSALAHLQSGSLIGLLTGVTAWRLIRGAERAKQPLLWIGVLPPVLTTLRSRLMCISRRNSAVCRSRGRWSPSAGCSSCDALRWQQRRARGAQRKRR
jgi:hypothetical protein